MPIGCGRKRIVWASALAAAAALASSTAVAEWTDSDDAVVSQFAGVLALARDCGKLDEYGPVLSKAFASYLDAHATTEADRRHAATVGAASLSDAAKEIQQSPNRDMYCMMAGGIVMNFLKETAGTASPSDPDEDP